MSAHTAGPWEAVHAGSARINIRAGQDSIAAVYTILGSPSLMDRASEGTRNAALIAAAPDLLDVARDLDLFQAAYERNTYDTLPGNSHYAALLMKVVLAARAAITKAEGR